jgi:ABC-2 type transport system permease protein
MLQQQLSQDYAVKRVDLTNGRVPGDVDVLLLIAPQGMDDKARFAVDQFLMRGGAVVVAAGNYVLAPQQFPGGLTMQQVTDGLGEMLAHYGLEVMEGMVMDPRNEPFPIQVQRQVGGAQVLEIQKLDYPFFVDVRSDGMDEESPIVSNLPAVTLHWTSPLGIDEEKNASREIRILLRSTEDSWLRSQIDVMPDTELYPQYGFPVEGEQEPQPLAVSVRGSFESFFKDKGSPFETQPVTETVEGPVGTVEVSPESSRLVVIGSAEFIDDAVLEISRRLSADRYLNNLQFLQNAVDWSVEDQDLLSIRSRGSHARLLKPLNEGQQSLWEGLNYAVALVALVVIGVVWNVQRRGEQPMELVEMEEGGSDE